MHTACYSSLDGQEHGTETNYGLKGKELDLTIFKLLLLADVSEVLQWELEQEMTDWVGTLTGKKN